MAPSVPASQTGGRSPARMRRTSETPRGGSELPAALRRGHVDLYAVGVTELEEPGRVGFLGAVHLDAPRLVAP